MSALDTPPFQGREKELGTLCAPARDDLMLIVDGEAGIGKSRLLIEARKRVRDSNPNALVVLVDLEQFTGQPGDPRERILESLAEQTLDQSPSLSLDGKVAKIAAVLNKYAEHDLVYLMFDTTEAFQEREELWEWLEKHLIGPLAVEGRVRQIFAGRIPAPLWRAEVRRKLERLHLEPLPVDDTARKLVREVLKMQHPDLSDDDGDIERTVELVLGFSFGHPGLSRELTLDIAQHWPPPASDEFKCDLGKRIVKPFIDDLFKDIEPEKWREILWWASVLDWFEVTTLREYLKRVAPALVQSEPDHFFVQGIGRLRVSNRVLWKVENGDRLHGVLKEIMSYYLKVCDASRYKDACKAAAETFQAVADEFADDPFAQIYRQQAEKHLAEERRVTS